MIFLHIEKSPKLEALFCPLVLFDLLHLPSLTFAFCPFHVGCPVDFAENSTGALNCQVEGETGENPSKCLAFSTNLSEKPYNDHPKGIGCCWTAMSNSDIPEDSPLKSVVNIDSDGSIHVHYQKFVATVGGGKADLSAQKGLLIPMLSHRWSDRIEFTLQPFNDSSTCRVLSFTPFTVPYRIVANSFHFSHTRVDDSIADRLTDRTHPAFRDSVSYARKCALCDDMLYLPFTLKQPHKFVITKLGPENFGFTEESKKHFSNHDYGWLGTVWNFIKLSPYDLDELLKIQRVQNLCPIQLRPWPNGFGFYLPFRLLWPYAMEEHQSVLLNGTSICDYHIVFSGSDYQLLVPNMNSKKKR